MKKFYILILAFVLIVGSVCVNAETDDLPENNKLISDEWVKGLGSASVKKETVDGEDVYTISNFDSTYASPYLDLYPTIKELIGEETEVSVYIVLDVRVVNTEENTGSEFPFGIKLRPACTQLTKSQEAFSENYAGEADSFKHQYGSVSASMASGLTATEEWSRVEMHKTFIDFDINDEFWTKWNLCFDGLKEFENGASLQVKNAGIFLEEDYESAEEEKENVNADEYITPVTPEPVTIYRPYGFDKYTATFTEVKEQDELDMSADGLTTDSPENDSEGDGGTITVIIIAAAVIAVGLAAVFAIKKNNKKERKGDVGE